MDELSDLELKPFVSAIKAGVPMVMLAHMLVPALDELPASVSGKVVSLLRDELGFDGVIATDALDMGALAGLGEERASRLALEAGVDILLHPSDASALALALNSDPPAYSTNSRLRKFRQGLMDRPDSRMPEGGAELVEDISNKALRMDGTLPKMNKPYLVALSDEGMDCSELGKSLGLVPIRISSEKELDSFSPPDGDMVLAVFSSIRAYKGGASAWLKEATDRLEPSAALAFGPQTLIADMKARFKIYAWWGGEPAQRAAGRIIKELL